MTAAVPEQSASVRVATSVVKALRDLAPKQRAAVAGAIRRIGVEDGVSLKRLGDDGRRYMVMAPGDHDAPVVVYRQLPSVEGGGYLITGLSDRKIYDTYTSAEEQPFLATNTGKALLGLGTLAAAIGIVLGSRSGRGGGPSG